MILPQIFIVFSEREVVMKRTSDQRGQLSEDMMEIGILNPLRFLKEIIIRQYERRELNRLFHVFEKCRSIVEMKRYMREETGNMNLRSCNTCKVQGRAKSKVMQHVQSSRSQGHATCAKSMVMQHVQSPRSCNMCKVQSHATRAKSKVMQR